MFKLGLNDYGPLWSNEQIAAFFLSGGMMPKIQYDPAKIEGVSIEGMTFMSVMREQERRLAVQRANKFSLIGDTHVVQPGKSVSKRTGKERQKFYGIDSEGEESTEKVDYVAGIVLASCKAEGSTIVMRDKNAMYCHANSLLTIDDISSPILRGLVQEIIKPSYSHTTIVEAMLKSDFKLIESVIASRINDYVEPFKQCLEPLTVVEKEKFSSRYDKPLWFKFALSEPPDGIEYSEKFNFDNFMKEMVSYFNQNKDLHELWRESYMGNLSYDRQDVITRVMGYKGIMDYFSGLKLMVNESDEVKVQLQGNLNLELDTVHYIYDEMYPVQSLRQLVILNKVAEPNYMMKFRSDCTYYHKKGYSIVIRIPGSKSLWEKNEVAIHPSPWGAFGEVLVTDKKLKDTTLSYNDFKERAIWFTLWMFTYPYHRQAIWERDKLFNYGQIEYDPNKLNTVGLKIKSLKDNKNKLDAARIKQEFRHE